MPALDNVPPTPLNARKLAEEAILGSSDKLLVALDAGVNAFYLSHGSLWGFLPEQILREDLEAHNIPVLGGSFPRVGGRKRIQEHAVIILS